MAEKISVRFIKRMTPYPVGQIAGFDLHHAEKLVRHGRAVFVNPPPGLDEYGKPIKKEPEPEPKKKAPKGRKTSKPDIPDDRKNGDLGTVKK